MTILTLQRRLREIGRIRTGDQQATRNGGTRPNKLDKFRLTSADRHVLEAAARIYGGQVQPWTGAPHGEQFELYTDTAEIAVIVPPGDTALTQFYETWSGGGCVRRCDGVTELLTDQPCLCAAEDEATCKPTTRLSVILGDLPGLGVWRVESHGYYAATELAGTVDVCRAASASGQLLPAVLRLEQRQVKRTTNGKPETRNFAVPILDVRVSPSMIGIGQGQAPAPVAELAPSWQAIAAAPDNAPDAEPLTITDTEMAAAMATPAKPAPAKRANSAPEIKPTGLAPRPAVGSAYTDPPADTPELPLDDNTATTKQRNMIYALLNGQGIKDDNQKHAIATDAVGREITSLNDLTKTEASALIDHLKG